MRIIELTNYSKGICGVWARVREEALRLSAKGHEVCVFSSDHIKGEEGKAAPEEQCGPVTNRRFPATKLGGEGFLNWKFYNEASAFKPEIIIAHSYRQLHTTRALSFAREKGSKA